MAYDEGLTERVRELAEQELAGRVLIEKKMFGGLAFLLNGNMAVGISKESLMVRLAPEDSDAALAEPGARVFDMTGRPMKGWLLVDPEGIATDADLRRWVGRSLDYAGSLPPK
ncbi:MAG: TfoX/Sxy family protein [Micromonosporaceae bacterium]